MSILKKWSFFQKLGFLFLFCFVVISIFPFPLGWISLGFIDELGQSFNAYTWDKFAPWFGKDILGLEQDIVNQQGGSGDTSYDYVRHLLNIVLAVIISIIWAVLDRRRPSYNTLKKWGVLYLRYYLVIVLFVYGLMKVIKLQFGAPSLIRLTQTYGDMSPMGLAWSYMGYSETYTIFAGATEVIAALLLLFKRTRTLGALTALAVMINVFMMNMSYDIPVKLFSFQLVLFSFFLVLLDGKRLWNLFFLNKATKAKAEEKLFKNKKWNIGSLIFKILLIGYFLISSIDSNLEAQYTYGSKKPKPELYGIYEIDLMVLGNDTIAPLMTDTSRWKQFIVHRDPYGVVKKMGVKKSSWFIRTMDSTKQGFTLKGYRDSTDIYKFNYRKLDSTHYTFEGRWKDSISVRLETTRKDEKDFLLTNRGFHWINERPYNR